MMFSLHNAAETAEQVRAAREAVGLLDQLGLAVLEVCGRDAADYLHRMLTSSVKTLQPGQGARSTILKGDGRMVSPATVLRTAPESFLLLAPAVCGAALAAHLDKFLITEDAEIRDRSRDYGTFSVAGPMAAALVSSALGIDAGKLDGLASATGRTGASEILVVRSDPFRLPGFLLLVPAADSDSVRAMLAGQVQAAGGSILNAQACAVLRVEAGEPEFGTDINESTIPLEAGLRDAIDFGKGCFPGQEVVARIDNLGHPARMLVGLILPPDADKGVAGTPLYRGGKETGRITSVVTSATLGQRIALATVKWDHREPGTELELQEPGSGIRAVVTRIPFVE